MSVGMPCLSSDDKTAIIPLTEDLTISICTSTSLELETGGSMWYACMSLTHHLLNHEHIIRDKVVLELGAGCALPGIAAGLLGAKVVILTDMNEQVPHIQRNVNLNLEQKQQITGCEFVCVPFMFGESIDDLISQLRQWQLQNNKTLPVDIESLCIDVVLGCDIAYDVSLQDPLIRSVQSLLLPNSVALLVEEVRWKDIYGWFLESLFAAPKFCGAATHSSSIINVTASDDSHVDTAPDEAADSSITSSREGVSDMTPFKIWYLANVPAIKREVRLVSLCTTDNTLPDQQADTTAMTN